MGRAHIIMHAPEISLTRVSAPRRRYSMHSQTIESPADTLSICSSLKSVQILGSASIQRSQLVRLLDYSLLT